MYYVIILCINFINLCKKVNKYRLIEYKVTFVRSILIIIHMFNTDFLSIFMYIHLTFVCKSALGTQCFRYHSFKALCIFYVY